MDITSIDADSTSDAAFAEIGFRGKIEEELGTGGLKKARVTIELVPDSGATTVITDQKSTRRPKEGRTGTAGRFDVVRNGRLIVVLVEELPAPAAQIVVTTSGPAGAGSRAGIRGDVGEVEPENFDELANEAKFINDAETARFARERVDEKLDKAEKDLEETESEADKTIDDIDQAQRDLINAKGGGAARDARERLERFKAKLKKLNQRRKALRENIKILERWRAILFGIGGVRLQCNDFVDNADPEDELADHPQDPGCVNAVDNDEKNNAFDLACPPNGGTRAAWTDINTPMSNSIAGHALYMGSTVIHQTSNQRQAGSADLGSSVCGAGTTVTLEYGAGANAPSGAGVGGTVPPPTTPEGDTTYRLLLRASGGAGASGQTVTLTGAIDTRAP